MGTYFLLYANRLRFCVSSCVWSSIACYVVSCTMEEEEVQKKGKRKSTNSSSSLLWACDFYSRAAILSPWSCYLASFYIFFKLRDILLFLCKNVIWVCSKFCCLISIAAFTTYFVRLITEVSFQVTGVHHIVLQFYSMVFFWLVYMSFIAIILQGKY